MLGNDDDLLAEDLALRMAGHGVSVVPASTSPADGLPEGWFWPSVLEAFVAALRGEPAPSSPAGRLCQECQSPVLDGAEYVEVPVVQRLSSFFYSECVPPHAGPSRTAKRELAA